jgi:hypothetical protein
MCVCNLKRGDRDGTASAPNQWRRQYSACCWKARYTPGHFLLFGIMDASGNLLLEVHLLHSSILLGWLSTLKMEVIHFSETSVHIRTTWRCISEIATFMTTAVRTSNPTTNLESRNWQKARPEFKSSPIRHEELFVLLNKYICHLSIMFTVCLH